MTQEHIRIIEELARDGVRNEWRPKSSDWAYVLELLEGGLIKAQRSGLMDGDLSWPDTLRSAHLSLDGRAKLVEWKDEVQRRTWKARIWSVIRRFTLWVGLLIGAAAYKLVDVVIEKASQ